MEVLGIQFDLFQILFLVMLGVSLFQAIILLLKGKKNLDYNFSQAWPNVRTLILNLVEETYAMYYASKSFDDLLSFCVRYAQNQINRSDLFTDEEKKFFVDEKILRSVIRPILEDLWRNSAKNALT